MITPRYILFNLKPNKSDTIYVLAPTYSIISYEPIISISPSSLSFPQTILGNTSTLSFTVTNTGNATLELTSIDLPTQFTSDFAPVVLEPSEDVTFQLTYEPINAGIFSVEVTLNSNAFVGNHTIEVTVTALAVTRVNVSSEFKMAFLACKSLLRSVQPLGWMTYV